MHKRQKKNRNIIKNIINFIKSDSKLFTIFNHFNQKYSLRLLLKPILIILRDGIAFRNISNTKINWNTIYKFFIKLEKYDVIKNSYYNTVNKYLIKDMKNIKNNNNYTKDGKRILITDTTLIQNKLGIDDIDYNIQLEKHKSTKISLLTTKSGLPINVDIYKSSIYDSKILNSHIDNFKLSSPFIFDNKNILLGDAGYDSNNIRNKLNIMKFGLLISNKNKRNTKDPKKIKQLELNLEEKIIIKNRIRIENTNSHLKQYKRIDRRYDKYSKNFLTFIYLACLDIMIERTC
jgi:hypothetical protein